MLGHQTYLTYRCIISDLKQKRYIKMISFHIKTISIVQLYTNDDLLPDLVI